MQKMGKVVALLVVLFSMVAAGVQAETSGDWMYSVSDGKATITDYTGTDTELVIPGMLGGYPVISVENELCRQNKKITSVVFPDTVENIGTRVLAWCSELESIVLPVNLRTLGGQAFFNCEKLKSIDLPHGLEKIGSSAFGLCYDLGDVYIPESVHEIGGGAFCGCESMKSLTVDESNENYVSKDGVLYANDMKRIMCYPADKPGTTYNIPLGVEVIGKGAFDGANHLQHVGIPDSVTRIEDSAFSTAYEIKELVLPDSITYIGTSAFWATRIESIIIPDSVKEIGDQALKWSSVSSVVLPNGLNRIEDHLFSLCEKLTSVNISATVDSIGQLAFYGCKSLKSLVLPEGVEKIEGNAFCKCIELESIILPKSVTSIAGNAFDECDKLVAQVYENSYAHTWCEENDVEYVLIDEPEGTHTHTLCGASCAHDDAHATVKYTAWDGSKNLTLKAGENNVVLTADVQSSIIVPAGATLNLCLNGHVLSEEYENTIKVVGGVLNLCDCTGKGSVTNTTNQLNNSYRIMRLEEEAIANLYNVMLSDSANGGAAVVLNSSLTMHGGAIKNNRCESDGGAIYSENLTGYKKSEISLYDVSIADNDNSYSDGHGVIRVTGGTLILDGCTISNNDATSYGAVYLNGGTRAYIANTSITNNESYGYGAGIHVGNNSTLELARKVIVENNRDQYNNVASDVYLVKDHLITLGDNQLSSDSRVGVYVNGTVGNGSVVPFIKRVSGDVQTEDIAAFISNQGYSKSIVNGQGVFGELKHLATYTVTFNANGGYGTMEPQIFTEGTVQALKLNEFIRDGYAFDGWNTQADGSGIAYGNGVSGMLVGDITLYAQWKKNQHVHKWNETVWSGNDTHHWHECIADGCDVMDDTQKDAYGRHEYANGVCICGKEEEKTPVALTINIIPDNLVLFAGESRTLEVAVTPENMAGYTVIWSSSDESIAQVDASGFVMGIRQGQVTITAMLVQKDSVVTMDTCEVTVIAPEVKHPDTGDDSNIMPYVLLMAVCTITLATLKKKHRME